MFVTAVLWSVMSTEFLVPVKTIPQNLQLNLSVYGVLVPGEETVDI